MCGKPSHNIRPHGQLPPSFLEHGCLDDLTTERNFDSQATWVIDMFGIFFDMLPMSVCTTRHW